jgi:hypothetical protein
MARQLQTGKTVHGDRLWLAALIDAMDDASRPEPHGLACNETTLSALRALLDPAQPGFLAPAIGPRYRHDSLPPDSATNRQSKAQWSPAVPPTPIGTNGSNAHQQQQAT